MQLNPTDGLLAGIALVELVQRLGGAGPLAEYCSLESVECEHQYANLFLADAIIRIAEKTQFALQPFLDEERSRALALDEPPLGGMA